jgi:hypothetical protein
MQASDDRVNSPQPCLLGKLTDHPILYGLPLEHPAGIGGYNLVRPKADAEVLLAAQHFAVDVRQGDDTDGASPDGPFPNEYTFTSGEPAPLLVVGRHGLGRAAAFTSDVAPHWIGGLVDWGPERIKAQAPGANEIEVGSHYAELFTRLVRWTMGEL